MKTCIRYCTTICLLSITFVSAQFNNGMGGNGFGRNNGMNQMGSMNQQSAPEPPKETPPEEIAEKYLKEMKPEVNLDELQVIAIKNVLIETIRTEGRIMKMNLPQEELVKEHKLMSENADRKIMDYLSKDQKEKYIIFKEKIKVPKKSTEKDKRKESKNKPNTEISEK